MLNNNALNAVRATFTSNLSRAEYRAGAAWISADITGTQTTEDGRVLVTFEIPATYRGAYITGVRLYDASDNIWVEETTNIQMPTDDTALTYTMELTVEEDEAT